MLFGKLMLQRPNVLLMDEPTNHMDMESIESLNLGLERYAGTLIFVSHDRQFVSSLATQIIEFAAGRRRPLPGQLRRLPGLQGHRLGQARSARRPSWPADCTCIGERFGQQFIKICQWYWRARVAEFAPGDSFATTVNGVFVKLFDRVLNPREIRRRLGLNQEQFWTQIGVTQSGGSRYESGRDMPKPVRELLRLVHVEQIDLSQVKRVDFEIISYLKESHADLYRSLRRAVRSKHRHPEGEPAVVDGDSVLRTYPATRGRAHRHELAPDCARARRRRWRRPPARVPATALRSRRRVLARYMCFFVDADAAG